MKASTGIACAACALVLMAAPPALHAQPQLDARPARATRVFNLPAQPLADALRQLGSVAGINVVFDPQAIGPRPARAVKGTLTAAEALQRLLRGTGFAATFTSPDTAVVKPAPAAAPAAAGAGGGAQIEFNDARLLDSVIVIGHAEALTATRADTPVKEIPQSVSVISRETLDQQNAVDLGSALQWAPGISVGQTTSQVANFSSRGYEITSVHVDGGASTQLDDVGGLANAASRNLDEYGGIEVLRGSDALFGGMGNPGGTVNMNRKVPTDFFQTEVLGSVGSWDNYHAMIDASGPLTENLSGRVVASGISQDYSVDDVTKRDAMLFGTMRYRFGPATTLTFGGSVEKMRGVLDFEGLPWNDDGTDPRLPRSLSLTPPWAASTTSWVEGFANLEHDFNQKWKLRVNTTVQRESIPRSYVLAVTGPIDTASALLPFPPFVQSNTNRDTQETFAATLTGSFDWWGHEQQVMLGADYNHDIVDGTILSPNYDAPPLDPYTYTSSFYPFPDFSSDNVSSLQNASDRSIQWGLYGALRLQPIEHLAVSLGGRLSAYRANDMQVLNMPDFPPPTTTVDGYKDSGKFTPYFGVTYDLSPHYTVYFSYADIYLSNGNSFTAKGVRLPPANGDTLEAGIKGAWFDNTLNASVALFKTDQRGIATQDFSSGIFTETCCYVAANDKSKGVDFEVSGMLTPRWQITAGYTYNIHQDVSPFTIDTPFRNLVKVWTNYTLPSGLWSVGGGLRSEFHSSVNQECTNINFGSPGSACLGFQPFGQGAYVLVDLRVARAIGEHWQASLNLNNVLDRRYYSSLGQLESGNWYAQPRNFLFKVVGKF